MKSCNAYLMILQSALDSVYTYVHGFSRSKVGKASEAARELFRLLALGYNPHHDAKGRFTSGGASGKIKKKRKRPKYSKSPRANNRGLTVAPKTFGVIRGEFNTIYANAKQGQRGQVSYKKIRYLLESDGNGSVIVIWAKREP